VAAGGRPPWGGGIRVAVLRVLDDDPLDDVGDVLAAVDRLLEQVVNLPPLDDLDRVRVAVEQTRDRRPPDLVALVLEPVDLDPVLLEVVESPQMAQRLV